MSPAARKMANEAKINLDTVDGTGKNGLILKEDIMSLMALNYFLRREKLSMVLKNELKYQVKINNSQKTKSSSRKAVMLTTFNEVDMAK